MSTNTWAKEEEEHPRSNRANFSSHPKGLWASGINPATRSSDDCGCCCFLLDALRFREDAAAALGSTSVRGLSSSKCCRLLLLLLLFDGDGSTVPSTAPSNRSVA